MCIVVIFLSSTDICGAANMFCKRSTKPSPPLQFEARGDRRYLLWRQLVYHLRKKKYCRCADWKSTKMDFLTVTARHELPADDLVTIHTSLAVSGIQLLMSCSATEINKYNNNNSQTHACKIFRGRSAKTKSRKSQSLPSHHVGGGTSTILNFAARPPSHIRLSIYPNYAKKNYITSYVFDTQSIY